MAESRGIPQSVAKGKRARKKQRRYTKRWLGIQRKRMKMVERS